MRVLVFGMSAKKVTGQDTFLMNMRSHMSENCIFDYVVIGDDCIYKEKIKNSGGEIYYVRNYWKAPVGFLIDLWNVCKKERKKHTVAYINLFSMVHAMPIVVCRFLGYNIVLHSHNSSLLRYKILHSINKLVFSHMRNVDRLACSQVAADFMYGKNAKWKMIHNAIDTNRFKYSEGERKKIRLKLRLDEKFVIGFVGRLETQKNPMFLVDLLAEIKDEDTVLLILGEGLYKLSMFDKAKEYGISDRIIFMGNVPDVHSYYNAMDVLLLPSIYEGLPIVLIEAQASGLPCIISMEGVSEEAIVNDELMRRISIKGGCTAWVGAIDEFRNLKIDKLRSNEIIKKSRYNIKKEAAVLESVLRKNECYNKK